MIKDLTHLQENAKHTYFAQQLAKQLKKIQIEPKPTSVAAAFNMHYQSTVAKSHTVRKWLIGETQPKSETLLLLARWLKVEPSELISKPTSQTATSHKASFEFDFTDQEVISKYLSMTVKCPTSACVRQIGVLD